MTHPFNLFFSLFFFQKTFLKICFNFLFFVCFFVFFFGLNSHKKLLAQDLDTEKQRSHLQFSPFHTLYFHYHNLSAENYQPHLASKTLYPTNETNAQTRQELAIKLLQILDANGLYLDFDKIPKNSNYVDSLTFPKEKKNIYIPFKKFPEIYVEKYANQWFYSPATVRAIPKLYEQTFPFDVQGVTKFLVGKKTNDKINQTMFWGLSLAHWIGLGAMLAFAYLAYRFLLLVLPFLIKFFIFKENQNPESLIFNADFNRKRSKRLARPLSWYLIFLLLYEIIPLWQFPARLSFYLLTSVRLALPIFAVIMGYGLVQILAIYLQENAKKHTGVWYEQLIPFIRATLQVIVIVFGFFYLLEALNVNVTGLVAGLSIGGLAVALAAQDSIKNLFGSLTIFIDRPFKVGDWITAEHIDGDVEEIGIRSTRIRTFANSILYIPNGKLADMIIDNLGMRQYRRYRTFLNVRYDTPPENLKAFIQGLREMVANHPKTRKDFYGIHFFEYGTSSLDILFYIFFSVPTFEEEWAVKEEINFLILELAQKLDIKFAFNTQTLHIESMPEKGARNG